MLSAQADAALAAIEASGTHLMPAEPAGAAIDAYKNKMRLSNTANARAHYRAMHEALAARAMSPPRRRAMLKTQEDHLADIER